MLLHENLDGRGTFGNGRSVLFSPYVVSTMAYDLDRDGDVDILAAASAIWWCENLDGRGRFGPARSLTTAFADSLAVEDLDGDGGSGSRLGLCPRRRGRLAPKLR